MREVVEMIGREAPHWERGYRCHGFWLGLIRIGFIGIDVGKGAAKKHGYGWSFDVPHGVASGRTTTLKAAKSAVEQAYRTFCENAHASHR